MSLLPSVLSPDSQWLGPSLAIAPSAVSYPDTPVPRGTVHPSSMFRASHLPAPTYCPTPEGWAQKENGVLKSFQSKTIVMPQIKGVLTGNLAWSLGKEIGLDQFFKLWVVTYRQEIKSI